MTGAGQAHIDCVERAKYEAVTNALLREVEGLKAALETSQQRLAALRAYVPAHMMAAYLLDRDANDAALSPASGGA